MASKWAFHAQASGSVLELEIYDVVDPNAYADPWWGSYGVSARQVLDTLKMSQDVALINVRINSAGGDVFDGMAIYNLLHTHPARVRVQIDGLCASIASIIAMAGDEIVMGEGTWMMIHKPYSAFMPQVGAEDLRKTADVLDKMTESMCAIYCARTGQSPDAVNAAMAAETWMTAADAKSLGYCTEVTPANAPEETVSDDAETKAMAASLLKTFARMPAGAFQAMARAHKDMKMTIQASAALNKTPIVAAGDAGEDPADALKKAKRDLEDLRDEHKKDKAKMAEDLEKAKKAKEDAEAALADFKKKQDDDDDDDSSSGADDKKAEARALAKLGLTAVALTGTKTLVEAEAALVALAAKSDKIAKLDAEMAVLRTERHQARVSTLIAEGKLLPSRKDWALSATAEQLDAYLVASGGEVIVPVAREFQQPEVKAPVNGKGVITAQDRAIAKHTGLTEEQLQQAADLRAKKFGV